MSLSGQENRGRPVLPWPILLEVIFLDFLFRNSVIYNFQTGECGLHEDFPGVTWTRSFLKNPFPDSGPLCVLLPKDYLRMQLGRLFMPFPCPPSPSRPLSVTLKFENFCAFNQTTN